MNLCGQEACGQPQTHAGRPRKGWIQVRRGGEKTGPWYCGEACLVHALTSGRVAAVDPTAIPVGSVPEGLKALNILAGTSLTIMTATPDRIRRAMEHALSRLVKDVDTEWERVTYGRPSTEVLLAEASGTTIPTRVCPKCRTERGADRFATDTDGTLTGYCRGCPEGAADPYHPVAASVREGVA